MSTLIDHDPADTWADILDGKNPIIEATDCGDGVSYEIYSKQPSGVYRGHPDYILSGSDLADFDRCPSKWIGGYRDEETKSTAWGQLVDCLLMEPDGLAKRFIVIPDTYTNEKGEEKPWNFNAKVCDQWREANRGRIELKKATLERGWVAATILCTDDEIAHVVNTSRKQVMLTGIYLDEETGLAIPLRALIDLAPPSKFLADLKTTNSAHPKDWQRHVYNFGYHMQAARHLDLWNAAHNDNRRDFRHYVQENTEPFEVAKRILSSEFIALGRQQYARALKRYARCLKTGNFPGYDDSTNPADIVIDGHLVTSPEAWMVGV